MALREQTESTGRFLHVQRGAICLKSDKPTEGYEEITGEVDGRPYTTYVKKFAAVDGLITKVAWEVREHEGQTYRGLKITIKDKGENYILDLPFGKRQYDYFTKIAENIDYEKPVEFIAWQDKKDARVTAFACKQGGKFVQWRYTREDMGDCPQPKQSKTTGKWSFDDQREWLLERILNVVIPHVDEIAAFREPEPDYDNNVDQYTGEPPLGDFENEVVPDEIEDSVPF